MSRPLAALRRSLDAMPSPVEDRPGFSGVWSGAALPFLRATAPERGTLLRYEQWNIDPASVVSFAALAFGRGEAARSGEGGA